MELASALAAQTYSNAKPATAVGASDGAFGLAAAAENFMQSLQQHEATARAAMTGTADPHALVSALTSSQLAVETVATVRDRVVEAYQEILRMPV